MAAFDLSSKESYTQFLCVHARVVPALEQALERAGIEGLLPDWSARNRSNLLELDLRDLGSSTPHPLPAPTFGTEAELWGAAYVLEGSKLGGSFLVKQVPDHLPSRYLAHMGPKGAIRQFMDQLDGITVDEDKAVEAASHVFSLFRTAVEKQWSLRALERED